MTRDYKAGGRAAGMAEHPLAQPVARARKTGRALTRSTTRRYTTYYRPSISAGTFKARKLLERGHGRHNVMVWRARESNIDTTGAKQPGRRYGPPPRSTSSGQGTAKRRTFHLDTTPETK